MYLAYVTNRSVIIPNVLGPSNIERYTEYFRDKIMWPWFRVPFFMKNFPFSDLQVIEPAYYWRIERDYLNTPEDKHWIPKPVLINITADKSLTGGGNFDGRGISLKGVEKELLKHESIPRLVLNGHFYDNLEKKSMRTIDWAADSVGGYGDFELESIDYIALPMMQPYSDVGFPSIAKYFVKDIRLCKNMFDFNRGNRSCFDKCD
jgi:hypothetical protein